MPNAPTDTITALTGRERDLITSIPTGLFIGGDWRASADGSTFGVEDPSSGQTLAEVASATPEDGQAALAAANAVQRDWARTAPRQRAEILRRAFEAVTERAEDFALVMTLEMGKTLAESRAEVSYAAEFLRWFSEEAARINDRYATAPDGANRLLVTQRPVGPALLITPWNFPLAMATRKIAPAIAAGCPFVLNSATLTPLTALLFTQVLVDVGLPVGVANVIPTRHAGTVTGPLIKDPRLRKLSFTGSTEVGQQLLRDASHQVLRTSMELGGNAPLIVFDDADLDVAIEGAILAKLRNNGEACTAANRIFVQEAIAPDFISHFIQRIGEYRVARGTDPGAQIGPLVDQSTRDKVESLVDSAVQSGATLALGGHVIDRPGYFFEPTVLTDVPADARILQEEIFGPVAPIVTFSSEQEAIDLANNTGYGLVAYAFTRDLDRGLRLAEELEVGMLGLNAGVVSNPAAPFGGVKLSGIGREGGLEGIEEYLETTYVGIANPFRSQIRTNPPCEGLGRDS